MSQSERTEPAQPDKPGTLFKRIQSLDEFKGFEMPAPPEPPVVIDEERGTARIVARPEIPPWHICVRCRHHWATVLQRESYKKDGRAYAEFRMLCTAFGEPQQLADEVVFECNSFERPPSRLRMALLSVSILGAAGAIGWLLQHLV